KDEDKKPHHNGTKPDGSVHIMNYEDSNGVLRSKGIKWVLKERNLWIPGLLKKCNNCKKNKPDPNNPNCCASRILSAQPDFAAQRSRLREDRMDLKHSRYFLCVVHYLTFLCRAIAFQ
ncbi:7162_t:CDS:2, partial [Dentiscutata heterogama]